MIDAQPEEIALVPNTTAGINLVAEGFPWQPGDNVVLPDNEFPTNQYPWMNLADRGVEARRVPHRGRAGSSWTGWPRPATGRTRIVSVSWVAYSSGWRHDLDRLAEMVHGRGALLFVDAIQGLGVFPLDVTPNAHRFPGGRRPQMAARARGGRRLLHPPRAPRHRLRPLGVGWNSVVHRP